MTRKASLLAPLALFMGLVLIACGDKKIKDPDTPVSTSVSISVSETSTSTEVSTEISGETSTEVSTETSSEASTETSASASETASTETSASEEESSVIKISFYIANLCGVDIGMVSTLDPVSREQVDLGELPAGQVMMLNLEWPREATIFDMAIYNVAGDLVSVSNIDITGVKESVSITLSGDNNLDNVSTTVE